MKKISVVGLGYVGSAMAIVLADAKNKKKKFFDVTGLDTNTNRFSIELINLIRANFHSRQKTNRFIIN